MTEQGVVLLGTDGLDHPRLVARAQSEGLGQALVELERIGLRTSRGESVSGYELSEIAKRLRRRP